VSARFLLGLFDSIYVVALSAWIGSILFISFLVAPAIFKVLGAEAGTRFIRTLLPRYYAWGAGAGAIALPSFVAAPLCYPEYRGPLVGIQALLLLVGTLIMLFASNSLTSAFNPSRIAGTPSQALFDRFQQRSLILNAVVLAIGLGLLITFVNRPLPKTSGIAELGPAERARFNAQLGPVIEELEAKYGLRHGRPSDDASPSISSSTLDKDALQELESYYRQKSQRDLSRGGRSVPSRPAPAPAAHEDAKAP
jgi:uncharacterized membrane protein